MSFTLSFVFSSLLASKYIKMFVLDEADEMLSRGFKDQIYEIFQKLNTSTQVRIWNEPCFLYVLLPGWLFQCVIALVYIRVCFCQSIIRLRQQVENKQIALKSGIVASCSVNSVFHHYSIKTDNNTFLGDSVLRGHMFVYKCDWSCE